MTICIFPGTFNPIHYGHIKMAEYALEKYKFEKIIFIPSYLPPHKEINKNLAEHRYKMVEIAIKDNPKFEISDVEYKSEGKSYSIITVKKIIEQYGLNSRLNFIIGTDAFNKIDTWCQADELKKLVHFVVFDRGEILDNISTGWDYELADLKFLDISSTGIRGGQTTDTIEAVEDYIKEHGLYKI